MSNNEDSSMQFIQYSKMNTNKNTTGVYSIFKPDKEGLVIISDDDDDDDPPMSGFRPSQSYRKIWKK